MLSLPRHNKWLQVLWLMEWIPQGTREWYIVTQQKFEFLETSEFELLSGASCLIWWKQWALICKIDQEFCSYWTTCIIHKPQGTIDHWYIVILLHIANPLWNRKRFVNWSFLPSVIFLCSVFQFLVFRHSLCCFHKYDNY